MWTPDVATALDAGARLAAVAVGVSAAEMLTIRTTFADGAVLGPTTVGLARGGHGRVRMSAAALNLALSLQLASAAVVIAVGIRTTMGQVALTVCLAACTAVRWRRFLGGDGAEQMASIVLIASWLGVVGGEVDQVRLRIAATFVGAQAALSYVTAGVAKLRSTIWRAGDALPLILATDIHGTAWAARIVNRHRAVAVAACWSVIVFECLFPVAPVVGTPAVLAVAAVGVVFHAGSAVAMGLNTFVWAFVATYPSLLAVSALWHG